MYSQLCTKSISLEFTQSRFSGFGNARNRVCNASYLFFLYFSVLSHMGINTESMCSTWLNLRHLLNMTRIVAIKDCVCGNTGVQRRNLRKSIYLSSDNTCAMSGWRLIENALITVIFTTANSQPSTTFSVESIQGSQSIREIVVFAHFSLPLITGSLARFFTLKAPISNLDFLPRLLYKRELYPN